MTLTRRLWTIAMMSCVGSMPALADTGRYPTRPVKLVVGFPAGGGADLVGRIVAQSLGEALGQPMIVENKAGATGLIAASGVAKSPPDGYTLLLGHVNALAIAPAASSRPPYDPIKDFKPVAYIGFAPNVLVINPAVTPASNVKELVALAKAKPGALSFASPGVASANHLAGEMFMAASGTQLLHVPYKGSAPAITDLLGGQVTMNFDALTSVTAYLKDGKMRALAVTTPKRSKTLPDVPTLAELGYKDAEVAIWYALMAPAGTSDEVIRHLNDQTNKVLRTAAVRDRLEQLGVEVQPMSTRELSNHIANDVARYTAVIKKSNIQMD